MLIPWLYLAAAVVGLGFTLQALRPIRLPRVLAVPSFFAGWLTNELVFHHYLWQALFTVGVVAAGALEHPAGWVALAVTLLQWGLNALVVRDIVTARSAVEQALTDALGPDHRDELPDSDVPWDRLRVSGLVVPFWFHHPEVRRDRDRVYARASGRDLRLDVYRHRDHGDDERRPVLLYVHGGAWVLGDKDTQGIPLMLEMASRGWVGVNADYRLSPWVSFPGHLIDVKRAIAWVRDHADELGADPSFVAVAGGSAGGHLAALTALTAGREDLQPGFEETDTSVQAAVPFYGVYDFTNRHDTEPEGIVDRFLEPHVMQASPEEAPERYALASPLDQVGPHAPPMMVIHGERDTLASPEGARRFVEAQARAGTRPVQVWLPGAQHAFDVFPSVRTAIVLRGVARFLAVCRARQRAGVPAGRQ